MKKRLILLLIFIPLLAMGILTGMLVRESHHEQVNHELLVAIKINNISEALTALKAGADPNAYDDSSKIPLSLGEQGKQLFDKILHRNIEPTHHHFLTALPLHISWSNKDEPAFVKALLDAGAAPDMDGNYLYAISLVVDKNHPQTLRFLLKQANNSQQLDKRAGHGLLLIAVLKGSNECIPLLIEAGADVNAPGDQGLTPLHHACQTDHEATVQVLLQHHADISLRDDKGNTPLDVALLHKRSRTAELLRKAGAKTGKELDSETEKGKKR
jgi:ankyrin repeat protein